MYAQLKTIIQKDQQKMRQCMSLCFKGIKRSNPCKQPNGKGPTKKSCVIKTSRIHRCCTSSKNLQKMRITSMAVLYFTEQWKSKFIYIFWIHKKYMKWMKVMVQITVREIGSLKKNTITYSGAHKFAYPGGVFHWYFGLWISFLSN